MTILQDSKADLVTCMINLKGSEDGGVDGVLKWSAVW